MSTPTAIHFPCSKCHQKLQAPIAAAGKIGACKHCGTKNKIPLQKAGSEGNEPQLVKAVVVPAQSQQNKGKVAQPATVIAQAIATSDLFADALADGIAEASIHAKKVMANKLSPTDMERVIRGKIPKRGVSLMYRVHLMMVTCVMVLLPMLYVALVATLAFGVGYYATSIAGPMMSSVRVGRAAIFVYAAIIAPVVAGTIMVLFMIKPLFSRLKFEPRRRSLTRQGQPVLFALIDQICDSTGAPKPVRVDVDYQSSAAAYAEKGLYGIVTGQFVLVIGVPLAATFSARQLAGVLAHEFGHFSQRIGMGANVLVMKISIWFTRVVYERDSLDRMLDDWIEDSDYRIGLILQLGKVGVLASRAILWCFMMLSYALSFGLTRQREYDADRYEYGLVGSKTFESTCSELLRVNVAQSQALELMYHYFKNGHLADDMIPILQYCRSNLSYELEQEIARILQNPDVPWYSTHPSDANRIARAKEADQPGVFSLDRPASDLFWNFDALCKGITWDFYRDQFGAHVSPDLLTPSHQLLPS
ncbi:MAG: M48 family metallopeptidase [Pirellulales bacterium]